MENTTGWKRLCWLFWAAMYSSLFLFYLFCKFNLILDTNKVVVVVSTLYLLSKYQGRNSCVISQSLWPIQLLQKLCGLPINTYFSAVKLRWLLDNCDAVKKAVAEERCLFGTVDSWLIWVRRTIWSDHHELSRQHHCQLSAVCLADCGEQCYRKWSKKHLALLINAWYLLNAPPPPPSLL